MEPKQIEIPKSLGTDPYEFTANQNEIIADLGNSLKWVSLPIFFLGSLCLMNFIVFIMLAFKTGALSHWNSLGIGLMLILQFLFFLLMARWTMTASVGFLAITKTQGKDISFLMVALNNLRAMFSVLAFGVQLFLIMSIVALVMNIVHYYRSDEPPVSKKPAAVSTVTLSPAPK